MSLIKLASNPSGTGEFTIAAPNSNTNRTLTLPDQTGTVLTDSGPISVNASTPTNAVTLDASGNLGIGTSSPNNRLTVMSSSGVAGITLTPNSNFTNAGYIYNDATYIMLGSSAGSTGYKFRVALTAPDNAATIDSSGNFLVGTTTTSPTTGGFCVLAGSVGYHVASHATGTADGNWYAGFRFGNNIIGSIAQSGGGTTVAYNTSSDYRLKENIAPMTGALAKVAALKPCTYKWKENGFDGEGFIAHELQEVCPQAVTGEKDAVDAEGNPVYQGIDTSFLVATLTAAIQEQQAIIQTLTARIAALEAK